MKRRALDSNVRMSVWKKYFGVRGSGHCVVCKRTIYIDDFEVGHNKAKAIGGSDKIHNLRPLCKPCNRSMGTMTIDEYKKKYFKKHDLLFPIFVIILFICSVIFYFWFTFYY